MKILAITASYRKNGIIRQAVQALLGLVEQQGHTTQTVDLLDQDIGFCTNCRHCTQHPGNDPGHCVLDDDMALLIEKIEQADALVLASPVNFGTATALYKRFLERLVVYGYWPWGAPAPKFRRTVKDKKAILIMSSAAPAFMSRCSPQTMQALRYTAKVVGARVIDKVLIGLAAKSSDQALPEKVVKRFGKAAARLGESG